MDYPLLLRDLHWTPRQDGPGIEFLSKDSLRIQGRILVVTSASLLVTSALLVVARSY